MEEIITITSEEEGIRIDKFLSSQLEDISRGQIQELITNGQVKLEGIAVKSVSNKTKLGNYEINLQQLKEKPNHLEAYDFPLEIIFEDEYLLVINKPNGLTVHPGAGNHNQTMANALIHYSKDNLSTIGGEFRPGIVHRLDKDTSGLIIVAKDDHTHQLLSEALAKRDIKRFYLALTFGCPLLKAGTIKTFVAKHKHDHTKMVVTRATGKEAITHYVVKQEIAAGKFSLLECKLDTGRTHQIRIHMHHKGFPLIGDPLYNENQLKYLNRLSPEKKEIVNSFKRQALHAYRLEFIHPISGELLEFKLDLPKDMQDLCQKLEQF
jgi:23S rRNA pseudouridine1911/1915/1917 synthase